MIREIDQLLDSLTITQVANQLNERGFRSGERQAFTARIVARLCRDYQLKSRYDRLREAGKLTLHEIAEQLNVTPTTVKIWRQKGLINTMTRTSVYSTPWTPTPRQKPKPKAFRTKSIS